MTGGTIDILYAGNKFTDIELCKMKNASDQCCMEGIGTGAEIVIDGIIIMGAE